MQRLDLSLRGRDGEPLPAAATFTRISLNQWKVEIHDGPHVAVTEQLVRDVSLYRLRRTVAPDEGDLYLEALRESLGRSTGLVLTESEVNASASTEASHDDE